MAQAHTHTHTPLSQDQLIGEDYAKMKAIPCKSVENTLEDPMKTMENEAAQAKSDGQNMEDGTPSFQKMRGIAALVWDSFE